MILLIYLFHQKLLSIYYPFFFFLLICLILTISRVIKKDSCLVNFILLRLTTWYIIFCSIFNGIFLCFPVFAYFTIRLRLFNYLGLFNIDNSSYLGLLELLIGFFLIILFCFFFPELLSSSLSNNDIFNNTISLKNQKSNQIQNLNLINKKIFELLGSILDFLLFVRI